MGLPNENYKGYVEADATQRARHIPSYSLFLMHGLADKSAPYLHGTQMARALTEAGVIFQYQVKLVGSKTTVRRSGCLLDRNMVGNCVFVSFFGRRMRTRGTSWTTSWSTCTAPWSTTCAIVSAWIRTKRCRCPTNRLIHRNNAYLLNVLFYSHTWQHYHVYVRCHQQLNHNH